ncbi:Uncharacterized protein DAT39_018714 [Clarias magur]|uniref:Uncharacterized protein n=1 Tax=Clarias magur TaxID=1594786 RepID=A0A8J4TAD5_CLAMG|nr:Uncharacterized protein DAT39_018714 [Clarias magur]
MAVQTSSSQAGEGVLEDSDGSSSPEVKTSKNEKRTMKKTNTNSNSDDEVQEGAGSEKNRGQKMLDEEMPLADVNGVGVDKASTRSDGEGEIKIEESSGAGDGTKTAATHPDGSKKRGNVETADAGRGRSGDAEEDSGSVYSSHVQDPSLILLDSSCPDACLICAVFYPTKTRSELVLIDCSDQTASLLIIASFISPQSRGEAHYSSEGV